MNLDLNFVIPLMGAVFVFIGLYIRLGNMKRVYWKSPRSMTSYIPLGLVFIASAYFDEMALQPKPIYYGYIALFGVLVLFTLWFSTSAPNFIKPKWIRWVEKQPQNIQKAMAAEAEGNTEWLANVTSEAAVEAWGKQITRKAIIKKK